MTHHGNRSWTLRPRRFTVCVVVVNYRGADDTIACLDSLHAVRWPLDDVQVIVVDNASGDGGAGRIAAAHPDVTIIETERNLGFAAACNVGASRAEAEFVAFLNNDARADSEWLAAALEALRSQPDVGAVASKVLDWDGQRIDYAGGEINFVGQGYKRSAGWPDEGQFETARDVLYPTGAGAVVRITVLAELGGFDERYFMFFEDVDLGWRMNLLGHRVRYVPTSIVFHRHHAAIGRFASYRERYLLARNGLLTVYKNFGDDALRHVLAPALMLAVHEAIAEGGADPHLLDLERTADGDDERTTTVDKLSLVGAYAVDYVMSNLAELSAQRDTIQRTRVRSDAALHPLLGDLFQAVSPAPGYHRAWLDAIHAFGLEDIIGRRRILVVTADTLTDRMAGPAIRAYNIAAVLAAEHEVRLVSTTTCTLVDAPFPCARATGEKLRTMAEWADIIVFQGFVMHHEPWLRDVQRVIVVDLYDPMQLEQLEQGKLLDRADRSAEILGTTSVLNEQMQRGDFFLCANEQQRHFWLGQLASLGRLNPDNYDRDNTLRSLLAVAPFGLPTEAPQRTGPGIKEVVPGIAATDKVVLWGGGVYDWLDPITLVHAIDDLRQRHDDVRLYFLGMRHPNPTVPVMRITTDVRRLADALGLTDKFVFFNDDWVSYDDRANYLLDADVGVSTHVRHIESTYAFRTRILDYIWAGLPIVATDGDSFSGVIRDVGLGLVVPERDPEALSDALERVLFDREFAEHCRAAARREREQHSWPNTLAPLVEFCRHADRAADAVSGSDRPRQPEATTLRDRVSRNVGYAKVRFHEGGTSLVVRRGVMKAARVANRLAARPFRG